MCVHVYIHNRAYMYYVYMSMSKCFLYISLLKYKFIILIMFRVPPVHHVTYIQTVYLYIWYLYVLRIDEFFWSHNYTSNHTYNNGTPFCCIGHAYMCIHVHTCTCTHTCNGLSTCDSCYMYWYMYTKTTHAHNALCQRVSYACILTDCTCTPAFPVALYMAGGPMPQPYHSPVLLFTLSTLAPNCAK